MIIGQIVLSESSINTGATFSPPAVIISSLILPVIFTNPSLSFVPRSPEWMYPSASRVSRVACSLLRYPMKLFLPLKHTSPSFSSPPSVLSLLSIFKSVSWNPYPTVPSLYLPATAKVSGAHHSLIP